MCNRQALVAMCAWTVWWRNSDLSLMHVCRRNYTTYQSTSFYTRPRVDPRPARPITSLCTEPSQKESGPVCAAVHTSLYLWVLLPTAFGPPLVPFVLFSLSFVNNASTRDDLVFVARFSCQCNFGQWPLYRCPSFYFHTKTNIRQCGGLSNKALDDCS